jgi:hypothetical protein
MSHLHLVEFEAVSIDSDNDEAPEIAQLVSARAVSDFSDFARRKILEWATRAMNAEYLLEQEQRECARLRRLLAELRP